MADTTVKQLAEIVGTPVDRLLQQMQEAGLPQKDEGDAVDEAQKESLLAFLKRAHGESEGGPKKITLKRRTLSTVKAGGSAGRGRTVNVEVRKKRTYVRREQVLPEAEDTAPVAAPAAPIIEEMVETKPDQLDPEAIRRAAHVAAEKEAEAKRIEAEERAAKAKAEEEAKARKAAEEAAKASPAKAGGSGRESDERIGSRKDKRDRKDIDLDEIKRYYEENQGVDEKPALVFPVNILGYDGETEAINNEEEMKNAYRECSVRDGDRDWDRRECFELVFPVTYIMPDGSTYEISSDEDESGWEELKEWYDSNPDSDQRPELQYPVDIITWENEESVNSSICLSA